MMKGIFLVIFTSAVSLAFTVIEVTPSERHLLVSQEGGEIRLMAHDYACIHSEDEESICGFISIATSEAAILSLDTSAAGVAPGTIVYKVVEGMPENPMTDTMDSGDAAILYHSLFYRSSLNRPAVAERHVSTISVSAESNITSPFWNVEVSVAPQLSLGVQLGVTDFSESNLNTIGELKGPFWGGHLTLNFYDDLLYQGIWIRTGLGYFTSIDSQLGKGYLGMLSLLATGGYRWLLARVNFGICAGFQSFVLNVNSNAVHVPEFLVPVLAAHVGLAF